jgi:sterol 3beta-glucosyltransferase
VHEGAETPIVGAVAAIAGFATTLGTNTADFSERLRRPAEVSHTRPVTGEKVPDIPEPDKHVQPDSPSPGQLEIMAQRMALKTYEDNLKDNLRKPIGGQSRLLTRLRTQESAKKANHGRAQQITSATGHYVIDVSRTCSRGKSRPSILLQIQAYNAPQHQQHSSTMLQMASEISHPTLLPMSIIGDEMRSPV